MAAPGFERILPRDSELEVIAHDLHFGEGPVWNRRTGELFWVDIIGDTIWKWTPGVGREIVMRPSFKADGMTFDREGRLVVAGWSWRRVWRMELDGTVTTLCAQFDGKKLNTPNDIVVKSDGSIWFTDPSGGLYNVEMHGEDVQRYLDFHGVFRISPSGETTLVVEDCLYPNGLAFSPDESLLYVNDTRREPDPGLRRRHGRRRQERAAILQAGRPGAGRGRRHEGRQRGQRLLHRARRRAGVLARRQAPRPHQGARPRHQHRIRRRRLEGPLHHDATRRCTAFAWASRGSGRKDTYELDIRRTDRSADRSAASPGTARKCW